ncbi:TPM domain-containing protein [Promicromonospora sp. NPDC057138]|uniref:TPM domain-containing protein n=1 Tax=Promicromonospora sp. NPDC057138 TaxID=3346031 RepID=UPI00362B1D16
MIESPARDEHHHDPCSSASGGWAVAAFAGLVGVVLAATSQAASATVGAPSEPMPSVSPRLTAAMQAELMSDVLPASPPITLTDPVTDGAGVLSDAERQEVRDAVDRLGDDSDLRMFVVYIESFDGTEPVDWANASANQSGLGADDLLLAIATADHEFGLSADSNVALTDAQLGRIDDAVAAAVEEERWVPAATDAADAVHESAPSGPSPLLVAGVVAVGVLVLAALGFVLWRLAAPRLRPRLVRFAHRAPASGGPTADELAHLSLTELDERAAAALVGIDDALKTCDQELGFARAELGADATRDFELILARAAGDVRRAFAIRQALDAAAQANGAQADKARADGARADEAGADEAGAAEARPAAVEPEDIERRTRLTRVVELCESAADTLDARTRAFDDLRRLQQRAPEVLADVVAREPEVAGRVTTARATLERLGETYPADTLAMVSGNPEQAELLLDNAKQTVAAGRSALEAGQKAVAVAHARGAQNALGQAVMLLDAVDATAAHLEEAAGRLDKAIASLTQDVASARSVEGDFRVTLARTAAQASLKHVEMTRDGGSPLAGLQRIAAAEASLDVALASTRDTTEVKARASALLRDTLGRVDQQLRQTADFVATRRGAIGATARTRLAEAVRLADAARSLQPTDPAAAVGEAQRASALVQEAARLARADADVVVMAAAASDDVEPDATAGTPGTDANGPITGGMMLGGILLDPSLVRSRSRRATAARIGGGFGGGGFGGGRPGAIRKLGTIRTWWPTPAR